MLRFLRGKKMTTAISSYLQPMMPFSPCNWVSDICQKIYDMAMDLFKTISDWFSGRTSSLSQTTTTITMSGNPRNLVAFYRGTEANNNNVTLNQILSWDDANLELVHTYIQWLFPLTTPSGPNPTGPMLDQATIDTFRNDPLLKAQVLRLSTECSHFMVCRWMMRLGSLRARRISMRGL